MKKLLVCLLLAFPLTVNANLEPGSIYHIKSLSVKLEPKGFRKPYMIWASHHHRIKLTHFYQYNGTIVAEFNVDGKVYLGWNPGCGSAKGYCPNQWIDTIEQLLDNLLPDYPNAGYVFEEDFIEVFYGQ